jgi:hypothetical protein
MHNDPKGKEILKKLEIERFYEVDDKTYEDVENLINSVKEYLP